MDHLVFLPFVVMQYAAGKGEKQTKQYGNGKEEYRKTACSLSQTDDRGRCGGRWQGELARRGAYGHHRPRPDSREHEQEHYTNQGIRKSKKLSINLVSRKMLPKADYVGSASGASVDKSNVFEYHWGENGTPVIDASPLTMECDVVDIYETEGFDNFICSVANTYAAPDVLDADGKLDYTRLKPVLFEFPTYSYIATGEIIANA